jgi:DNA-binding PadR family transcriptional regulator
MAYVGQDTLEKITLLALFDYVQEESGFLSAKEVTSRLLKDKFSETRVAMALRKLDADSMVRSRHDMRTGSSYEISEEGYKEIEQNADVEDLLGDNAPTADGFVSFNHNAPEFEFISGGIDELKEAVRTTNGLPVTPEERDRIMIALDAAKVYWQSTQLKYLQVKVGILMAVEDAARVLASTAKATAAALLVDAIKAFFRTHTGLDLDKI